jgi:hypothetical protein
MKVKIEQYYHSSTLSDLIKVEIKGSEKAENFIMHLPITVKQIGGSVYGYLQ